MSRVLLSRNGEIVCMFVFRCPSASELKRQDSKRVRTTHLRDAAPCAAPDEQRTFGIQRQVPYAVTNMVTQDIEDTSVLKNLAAVKQAPAFQSLKEEPDVLMEIIMRSSGMAI